MDNLKEELEKKTAEFLLELPLKTTEIGWEKVAEDVQDYNAEILALFESYVKARRPDKKDRTVTDSEGDLVYFYQSKWDKGYNQCSEDYEQSLLGGNKQ